MTDTNDTLQEKKVYHSPTLVEWGDVEDLTLGAEKGVEDYPALGGSQPY